MQLVLRIVGDLFLYGLVVLPVSLVVVLVMHDEKDSTEKLERLFQPVTDLSQRLPWIQRAWDRWRENTERKSNAVLLLTGSLLLITTFSYSLLSHARRRALTWVRTRSYRLASNSQILQRIIQLDMEEKRLDPHRHIGQQKDLSSERSKLEMILKQNIQREIEELV